MKLTDKQIETLRWIRRVGVAWPTWTIHASTRRALGKRGLIEYVEHRSSAGYRLTEKAEALLDELEEPVLHKTWKTFTRRTRGPKLRWLGEQLDAVGIPHRRVGNSIHGSIMEVPEEHLDAAWAILDPVDDVPDDDPRFKQGGAP